MQRFKIRDEQDARACLKKVEASRMERTPWAQAHGVDARSLHPWWLALERRKKHEGTLAQSSVRLVEVVASPAVSPARYRIPAIPKNATQVRVDTAALAALLAGIDFSKTRKHWWNKSVE